MAVSSRTLKLRVSAKKSVADGVVVLDLEHPDGARLPDWTPGAHIDLMLPGGLIRQYSLCGDRWDACRYRVAVLREPEGRGGSAYVHDRLQVGDGVGVGGPRNNFPLVPSERYLFLAGGIGITPLLPMIHQAQLTGADWNLVYGGRSRGSMAFLDELAGYGPRVHVVPEDTRGRPDLQAWLGDVRDGVRVYCCGPAGLLDAVEAACAHWPTPTLRTERFAAAQQELPVRDAPFEVVLANSGTNVTVTPGTTVLEALRRVGVDVLSSCMEGVCGTCETTVLDGRVDHRDALLSHDERVTADRMFPCVSRACGDRLVLDL
ncbi:PDR/VanB family oxidoreductase [Streptomyces cahuitamycinicus]|uniref:Oxidoreductase n=1 Tax=Streptomyces cahuitamycinicus TaxID=2070367 RepID=A0A2N8TXV3_9ACTN|nr:PDR/VanB family oxidoreductase [Streptomyces cahuitamycinicus]PNG23852.1 oxidoreductase [Streptomyces cahuitamycinicus]